MHSYVFQHVTRKDGLASDNVNGIFRDSRGYYWLGTASGLQKFDGKRFIELLPAQASNGRHAIGESVFGNILEDRQGNIWMLNHYALSVYYRETGKIDRIIIQDDTAQAALSGIRNFCLDEWGNIWIVTSLNIYKFDFSGKKCVLWLPIGRGNVYNATFLTYDADKKGLWMARDRDVFLIDISTKKVSSPFLTDGPDHGRMPAGHFISAFSIDGQKRIWCSDYNGLLYQYNTRTCKRTVYDRVYRSGGNSQLDREPNALCFAEDQQGVLWMGSYENGLLYYDDKGNVVRSFPVDKHLPTSLQYDYYINFLFCDNEGSIWAGTDKGIHIFNPGFQQFTTVGEDASIDAFPKSEVTQLFETSSGNILVGSYGKGWFMYDRDFNLKYRFCQAEQLPIDRKNLVWAFEEDRAGKIWIGYQYGLIGVFDTVSKVIRYRQVAAFEGSSVMAIQCDPQGNMWFGLHSGALARWDIATRQFSKYKHFFHKGEQSFSVRSMSINDAGELWVATSGNGFYCFDPLKEKISERYVAGPSYPGMDNMVTSITQLNDSMLGVATIHNGFFWFNKRQKTFLPFAMNDGLPVNCVYGLAMDKQDHLWIATTNGLIRRHARDATLTSFAEEDGIGNNKFVSNFTVLHDGRMAIATSTGFVYFSPEKINRLSAMPPDVQITGFTVFDRSLFIDSLLSGHQAVRLGHRENFFTISYTSISFLGRNDTRYYYQLDGVDEEWVSAGTRHFANYTSLRPGRYTFRVKCESRDGIFSNGVTGLTIYISPPWWFTWWAYTLYAALAVVLLFALYRNRVLSLEKRLRTQLQVMVIAQEAERKRISRDLHDDIGTKLSALKLFLSSLYDKAVTGENEEMGALAESAGQFVTEAMQDIHRLLLNLDPAVLEEFGYSTAVEVLVNKINETRCVHFNLRMFGMNTRLLKDDELNLYRITQELISNVLKHAEAKHVSLQIGRRDKKFILMIEDDGKGFDSNARQEGYGLHNLAARTQLMQGIMVIDSQPGKGTSVLIEIPDKYSKS